METFSALLAICVGNSLGDLRRHYAHYTVRVMIVVADTLTPQEAQYQQLS